MRPFLLLSLLPACLYVPPTAVDALLDPDADGVPYPEDCAPNDAEVSPSADERCGDGRDNDCDGSPGACAAQDAGDAWLRLDGAGEGWGAQLTACAYTAAAVDDIIILGRTSAGQNAVAFLLDATPGVHPLEDASRRVALDVGELALTALPDINADAYADLAVGRTEASSGAFYLLRGPSLEGNYLSFLITNTRFGFALAYGGAQADAEGPLLAVGAADAIGGYVKVLHRLAALEDGAPPSDFVDLLTNDPTAASGLAFGADVDGDGADDLWVSAPGQAEEPGTVWWVSGPLPQGDVDLADVALRLDGPEAGAALGSALLGDIDLDGDGYADLAATAPGVDAGGTDRGAVVVYRGGPGGPEPHTTVLGHQDRAGAGLSLAALQDFWGAGSGAAIAVGQPYADTTLVDAGTAWVLAAGLPTEAAFADAPFHIDGDAEDMRLGASLADAGDQRGDGWPDLVVGAPGANAGAGAVLLTDAGY